MISDFFANDTVDPGGYAQAKYVLGSGGADASNFRHFLWSYPADLRGKYISATATRNDYFGFATIGPTNSWQGFVTTTSELSMAIAVQ